MAVVVLLSAWPALGQESSGFSFPNFADTTGLQVTGDATQVGNVLRLTSASLDQAGGVSYLSKRPVANGFETRFQFQITALGGVPDCEGKNGADGLAFVFQGGDGFALGQSGQG